MLVNKCRINNLTARNVRRDASYQMVLIDLALIGAIKKEDAECLLGYEIPSYIQLPNKAKSATVAAKKVNTPVNDSEDTEGSNDDTDNKAESFFDKLKGLQK